MSQNYGRGTNEANAPSVSARERIDHCAYELFSRRHGRRVHLVRPTNMILSHRILLLRRP